MQEAIGSVRKEINFGIQINGERIGVFKLADDIDVLVDSKEELQTTINVRGRVLRDYYNIIINKQKRKFLICGSSKAIFNFGNTALHQVIKFNYMRSKITLNAKITKEINYRILQAKIVFK